MYISTYIYIYTYIYNAKVKPYSTTFLELRVSCYMISSYDIIMKSLAFLNLHQHAKIQFIPSIHETLSSKTIVLFIVLTLSIMSTLFILSTLFGKDYIKNHIIYIYIYIYIYIIYIYNIYIYIYIRILYIYSYICIRKIRNVTF